ncbi:MAG: hypothetical protein ACRCY8_10050 [Dermatophilaceae bacterium]
MTTRLPSDPDAGRARALALSLLAGSLAAEILSIAIVWLLVSGGGAAGAAWLVPQLLAAIVSGTFGRHWSTRWRPVRVVICSECVRLVAALTALCAALAGAPVWTYVVVGVIAAAARPHHDAGVMASLRLLRLSATTRSRQAARLDNTLRLARVAGPGVAAASAWGSRDGFTLGVAAVGFALAALLATSAGRGTPNVPDTAPPARADPSSDPPDAVLRFCFLTQALTAGTWYLGFVVCVALLLDAVDGPLGGLAGFGLATSVYGAGNLLTGLAVARLPQTSRVAVVVLAARLVAAGGFLVITLGADRPPLVFVGAAIVAAGTPIADVTFIRYVQTALPWTAVAAAARRKSVSEYGGMLVALSVGSAALHVLSPRTVVLGCAAAMAVLPSVAFLLVGGRR